MIFVVCPHKYLSLEIGLPRCTAWIHRYLQFCSLQQNHEPLQFLLIIARWCPSACQMHGFCMSIDLTKIVLRVYYIWMMLQGLCWKKYIIYINRSPLILDDSMVIMILLFCLYVLIPQEFDLQFGVAVHVWSNTKLFPDHLCICVQSFFSRTQHMHASKMIKPIAENWQQGMKFLAVKQERRCEMRFDRTYVLSMIQI